MNRIYPSSLRKQKRPPFGSADRERGQGAKGPNCRQKPYPLSVSHIVRFGKSLLRNCIGELTAPCGRVGRLLDRLKLAEETAQQEGRWFLPRWYQFYRTCVETVVFALEGCR